MKRAIAIVFVSLAIYVFMASAQLPTTWTNPYYFFSNINTPLAPAHQKISADKKTGNQQLFTNNDDHSMQNTLGSHVVLLTTCLRDLKTTKTDLAHTTQRLDQTHTVVESVKKELKDTKTDLANTHSEVQTVKKELVNVLAVVENLKKEVSTTSSIGRMPKSCDDLQKIGHRKSGFFPVMGHKTVDNVYCDFTKPSNDAGFQKLIGYFDVKTSPVYFHAQKSSNHYMDLNHPIPFDLFRLNVGNAMNTNGIFVAPTSGKYFFAYSGISNEGKTARVEMQMKTETADWSKVGQAYGTSTFQTYSLQSTVELAVGNKIRLVLLEGSLHDDAGYRYTNFIGRLLEEDILP